MNTRINGILKAWNGDKGFGFITPSGGGQDIFLHISDFPKHGGQPKIGEPLTFLTMIDKDGRKKAILVQRPGASLAVPRRSHAQAPAHKGTSTGYRLVGFIVVAILCAAGYKYINRTPPTPETFTSVPNEVPIYAASSPFRCDGRTRCSQMTSCKEAKFFLKNCPNTVMDGDGDGIPCESQWCTTSASE